MGSMKSVIIYVPWYKEESLAGQTAKSVSIRDVHKSFGPVQVVKGLNIDIPAGEFLVLLGPSGCGKTTALRMIAGLETVDEGEIRIGDEDVTGVLPKYRDVAMVFQSYALYPHKTVAENIGFPLKVRGLDPAERDAQVRDAASQVHLDDYLERLPKQLSGGQRQRVALARAIVRRPSVFLMDEPLSNLDAKLRGFMRSELKADAAFAWHYHDLCDPRPDRGHDPGAPGGDHGGRRASADRHPAPYL